MASVHTPGGVWGGGEVEPGGDRGEGVTAAGVVLGELHLCSTGRRDRPPTAVGTPLHSLAAHSTRWYPQVGAARLAAVDHVAVSRRGRFTGPLDSAPAEHGLSRQVSAVPPGHLAAMALAASGDVVCLVPTALPGEPPSPLGDAADALGLRLLDIPLPPLTIGMAWHPRHSTDGAHQWLRGAVRRVLGSSREK